MTVEDAQREVREVYLNSSVGSIVSATLWLGAAALGSWVSPRAAILTLMLGGVLIFPVTQLALRAMGRRASLSPDNPFAALARQVAITVPLGLPLVGAATLHRLEWFFPATMIVIGSHYLPFTFLYGMRAFTPLALALVAAGVLIGLYVPHAFPLGGWLTGGILLVFGLFARGWSAREARQPAIVTS
jgi:hypothetical protein